MHITTMYRRALIGTVALLAPLGFGLGAMDNAVAAKHHKKHHVTHHHTTHHSSIPQHNGGDHDADNSGGPSDGDGSM